jgi:glycosyltransferase involved in cell wall biosynthesis
LKTTIAVFTNQFPGKVNTFIARDLCSLIENGYKIDIFTIYPIREKFWKYVPEKSRKLIRSDARTIFVSPLRFGCSKKSDSINWDIEKIITEARYYGYKQYLKSLYVLNQALNWVNDYSDSYEHMISYWGNYAGTYGFISNKVMGHKAAFSIFLHAGTDLYRDQIYLKEKMLYADKIITECNFNHEYIKGKYPLLFDQIKNKIIVYTPGLDIDDFKFCNFNRDNKTILTIGSFFPQKGFSYAIKAFAKLSDKNKDLQMIMIGDGPEYRSLLNLSKKLRVRNKIQFAGWMTFENVKKYLDTCTMLVHPSCDMGDASPNVIKEAMASGLPVVGSNMVGIPELLDYGRCGILVEPRDIDALAESIKYLVDNPNKRSELAVNARKYAEDNFRIRLGDVLTI